MWVLGGGTVADAAQGNVNLHGVFLHVLGDALGSVGVLISGLCLLLMPWSWKVYIDPIISLLIAGIILYSTIPLVRHTARIVLQGVPENVDLSALRAALRALPGVQGVHELHCWCAVSPQLLLRWD
jgi:zinc transporter 1